MILSDNTRKIIFPRNFFGKTIFSGRLEKENMISVQCVIRETLFHSPLEKCHTYAAIYSEKYFTLQLELKSLGLLELKWKSLSRDMLR